MKRAIPSSLLIVQLLLWGGLAGDESKAAPHVLSVSPVQNGLNALQSCDISVTFDTEMDPGSIDTSSFIVYSRLTGLRGGEITLNGFNTTATFTPSQLFHVGEVVTVSLTSDIRSSQGIPLEDGFVWSFAVAVDGGNGTFIPDTTYSVGNSPHSVFAGDFDSDGDVDLATANQLGNSVSILYNDGTGMFASHSMFTVSGGPLFVTGGDFDGDNDLDLATANALAGDVSILVNDGAGGFSGDSTYPVGSLPLSVFAADLDCDGDIDLAAADTYSDSVTILENIGMGAFLPVSNWSVGREPWSITGADLDSDGDIDLATANDVSFDVSVLLNDGNGTFAPETRFSIGHKPVSITATDLDGDGDADLVTANDMSDNVTVLLNDGLAVFAVDSSYSVADKPVKVHAADLDGDGDIDLATANNNADKVSILLNNGSGMFGPYTSHPVGSTPRGVFAVDLDDDGDLDLATANLGSNNVTVLFNALVCFDSDGDGFGDPGHPENQCDEDNCPFIYNPSQEDYDGDDTGDSCDVCPYHPNDDCCNPIGSNHAPNVDSPPADTAMPGSMFVYVAEASDPDCDGTEVELTFNSYPSWCSINGDTVFGWVECDYADTSFKVQAFDGSVGDLLVVTLLIDKSNAPPQIADTTDHFAVRINRPFAYYPVIDDPDDLVHVISYSEVPSWCSVLNDSVIGTAPDTLSSELLTVIVADYCHSDTVSYSVSSYLCGDADADIQVDIDDVIFLINFVFLQGPAPLTYESADPDCSGRVDIDDMVYLLSFIFLGGPAPCDDCPW